MYVNLPAAARTALIQEDGPGGKRKILLAVARYTHTRCFSKQGAKYTWHIWKAGQFAVPGRKWTPDRGAIDSVWLKGNEGLLSLEPKRPLSLRDLPLLAVSLRERPGLSIPELYIFQTN